MEAKGIRTDKGELNRWIKATNRLMLDIKKKIKSLFGWISEVKEELSKPKTPSLAALLIGCVSAVPALAVLKDMDDRGQTMNAAFLVCAASALAAHLGFTLSVEPNMALPLLLTKFLGGFCGIAAALLLTGKAERRRKGQRSRIGN